MLSPNQTTILNRFENTCDSLGKVSVGERVMHSNHVFKAPGKWAQTKKAKTTGKPNWFFRFVQALCFAFSCYTDKKCIKAFKAFEEEAKRPLEIIGALVYLRNTPLSAEDKETLNTTLDKLQIQFDLAKKGVNALYVTYRQRHPKRYKLFTTTLKNLHVSLNNECQKALQIHNHINTPLVATIISSNSNPKPAALPSAAAPMPLDPPSPPSPRNTAPAASPALPPPPPPLARAVSQPVLPSAQAIPSLEGEPLAPPDQFLEARAYKQLSRKEIEQQCVLLEQKVETMKSLLASHQQTIKEYEIKEKELNDQKGAKESKKDQLARNKDIKKILEDGLKLHVQVKVLLIEKNGTHEVSFFPDAQVDAYNRRAEEVRFQNNLKADKYPNIEETQKFSLAIPTLEEVIADAERDIVGYESIIQPLENQLAALSQKTLHGMNFKEFRDYIKKKEKVCNDWARALDARVKFLGSNGRQSPLTNSANTPVNNTPIDHVNGAEPEDVEIAKGLLKTGANFREFRLKKRDALKEILAKASPAVA